jgi:hypothetical protein
MPRPGRTARSTGRDRPRDRPPPRPPRRRPARGSSCRSPAARTRRPPGVARERLVEQKAQPDKLAVAADEQAPGQIGRAVRLPVGSRAPCRLGGARRRRQLELGILLEDSTLEVAQPLRGLDAELVEAAAKLLIGAKSFGVAARAVEDEYLLGTQPLAKWVAGDERLKLADELGVAAEG